MVIHWMYRVTRGMDSTDRGTLVCWEDPPLAMHVRFIPDREGESSLTLEVRDPKEPVIGENMNYGGTVFRAYGKMDTSAAEDMKFTRVAIKMPMRTQ